MSYQIYEHPNSENYDLVSASSIKTGWESFDLRKDGAYFLWHFIDCATFWAYLRMLLYRLYWNLFSNAQWKLFYEWETSVPQVGDDLTFLLLNWEFSKIITTPIDSVICVVRDNNILANYFETKPNKAKKKYSVSKKIFARCRLRH